MRRVMKTSCKLQSHSMHAPNECNGPAAWVWRPRAARAAPRPEGAVRMGGGEQVGEWGGASRQTWGAQEAAGDGSQRPSARGGA